MANDTKFQARSRDNNHFCQLPRYEAEQPMTVTDRCQ